MKSFLVAFLSLMFVGEAMSTLCSDQCNGACTINKNACDASVVLGPLCDIQFASCSQGCSAVCGCVDGCEGQCQPDHNTCTTNANGNPIFLLECAAQRDVCLNTCGVACSVQTAISTVAGVLGMGSV